jgi:hypothetical protein
MATRSKIRKSQMMDAPGYLYRTVLIGQNWTPKHHLSALVLGKKDPADRDRKPPLSCGSSVRPIAKPIPCRLQ